MGLHGALPWPHVKTELPTKSQDFASISSLYSPLSLICIAFQHPARTEGSSSIKVMCTCFSSRCIASTTSRWKCQTRSPTSENASMPVSCAPSTSPSFGLGMKLRNRKSRSVSARSERFLQEMTETREFDPMNRSPDSGNARTSGDNPCASHNSPTVQRISPAGSAQTETE